MRRLSRVEPGSVQDLGSVLEVLLGDSSRSHIVLVTGEQSYRSLPGRRAIEQAISAHRVTHLSGFRSNPRVEDLERARDELGSTPVDLVMAVGGGTVIDIAKLLVAFRDGQDLPRAIRGEVPISTNPVPIIAIPTTAGSGSEATHFAVVYDRAKKFSVAHPDLRPRAAIVDSDQCRTLSSRSTAHSGLDVLCQGIESIWSVNATAESMRAAEEAVALAWDALPAAVREGDPDARAALSRAAWLAGVAIDRTKTTAPHALSYTLTARFGIPHGLAVALMLPEVLLHNAGVRDEDCSDPRGASDVRARIARIVELLGAQSVDDAVRRFRTFVRWLGMPATLAEAGVTAADELGLVASGVNTERLANNPRTIRDCDLPGIVDRSVGTRLPDLQS